MGNMVRRGGAFLVEETPPEDVFTPEDFREEHKMIIVTTEDFVKNEVVPHLESLEHKDFELAGRLMRKAGELGLLGADVPEQYGGGSMGIISSLLICEHFAESGSFGVTINAHTGIGTSPIVFFGNEQQKQKYLPPLAKGEKIAAYALTEPGAGTDALSIQTTAKLTEDGKHYRLNGTKQFITNGGFADIIMTYAKVDGDKFTSFVVENDTEGLSTGPEEKKMGIRGTSTVSVIFEDAKVPAENVIFEVGRGHIVAFNILDIGRFKLAAGAVGVSKLAIDNAVKYGKERVQFGKPVCEFGLIKHKIAEMAIRTYIAESMVYRTGGLVEAILASMDHTAEDLGRQSAKSISEYAIECSINKVFCTEVLSYVADEAVQIYGGYGYIEDYPVERIYRDCRIFRIFEGTNEINRVITVGFLMRKALKNEIPLLAAMENLRKVLPEMAPVSSTKSDGSLEYQRQLVERAKKTFLFLADAVVSKYGEKVNDEEELLGYLSDIAIEVFAMESGLLRATKAVQTQGEEAATMKTEMVKTYVSDAMTRITDWAKPVMAVLGKQMAELQNLTHFTAVDTIATRRSIADRIIAAEKFVC